MIVNNEIIVCKLCNSRWDIACASAHLIQQHNVNPQHISMFTELIASLFDVEQTTKEASS